MTTPIKLEDLTGPRINFIVGAGGKTTIKPQGLGDACHAATAGYEKALGNVTSDVAAPDGDQAAVLDVPVADSVNLQG